MTAPLPANFSGPARVAFGIANLLTAALVVVGVFVGLPERWWPVDVPAALLALLETGSGVGLLASAPWAARLTRVASGLALALGLLTVSLLAVTASWLSGVYGPVGRGGALVLALVGALSVPYVVVFPAVELVWLRGYSK